ncbi:MAG TPA: hypothetical protein P5186_05570 [Candidatus Paceibacterota bacterium]|nr:hypothetical protein [Verrucomicrobiota bacterium]HRY47496.1 hypothetical protein [Candidatus Paceibacterota bacterium]HSA00612.1 hypothetical protein [Candidatus Paceibacterota bacterium]
MSTIAAHARDPKVQAGRQLLLSFALLAGAMTGPSLPAAVNVYLTDVPDYAWYGGCFGTACGNLMGFWDRHGFPDFYTGPTADGVAPLNSAGANHDIVSLWTSKAGRDGRPSNQPGHEDDYWIAYESTDPDPFLAKGRAEHEPDCLGDFIGLSQRKWINMNGECDGNVDGFTFVYWDATGSRRVNFTPGSEAGLPPVDMQSGLRAWTHSRGAEADVFTQLTDFNPEVSPGQGFTFNDLRAEIDSGYPVLLFMQDFSIKSRPLPGMDRANPHLHGMLAYGYYVDDEGAEYARFRTSWASGDNQFNVWTSANWLPGGVLDLPLRGVIGYHPRPKILKFEKNQDQVSLEWHGPASELANATDNSTHKLHLYHIEKTSSLIQPDWTPITDPSHDHQVSFRESSNGAVFYRVVLETAPLEMR